MLGETAGVRRPVRPLGAFAMKELRVVKKQLGLPYYSRSRSPSYTATPGDLIAGGRACGGALPSIYGRNLLISDRQMGRSGSCRGGILTPPHRGANAEKSQWGAISK